jgi:acyl CoA:acetate/3-ketoacid CoA transferase
MSHLLRDIAARKPGSISRVGLGTFADTRHGAGKVNGRTADNLVELHTIDGEEHSSTGRSGSMSRCCAGPRPTPTAT